MSKSVLQTQTKKRSDFNTESDLDCRHCSPPFVPPLKTCTNIEFDYSKSIWTDGSFMKDASQMTIWKNKIGDFWENSEDFYPMQPYQPGNT